MIAPAPSSPSELLRQATHERHKRIERVHCLSRLFAKDYTLDEYRNLLARLYGFHAAVEPRLAAALDAGTAGEFRRPRKTPWLADDLRNLGLSGSQLADLPIYGDLAAVATATDAVGVLYVLEGSTQGGVVIRKHLAAHFGAGVAGALRFYTGYGEETKAYWQSFKNALDATFATNPEGVSALIEAANGTFERLTGWLEQTLLDAA